MNKLTSIVVIPARLESSRLPQKVLADINGQPMLWHVYQRCLQADKVDAVHIATDSEQVAELAQSWKAKVWLTDSSCVSGTERIASIIGQLTADIIINVQGDQPLIEPSLINQLVATFEQITPLPDIVTPVSPISQSDKIFDPNLVKVVRRDDGYALYFSRHPIPYLRDVKPEKWAESGLFLGHIGIYGYQRSVLENYHSLAESSLETAEKLEQLRFL
ncbi:MAG: 3-deoxy-manno-octulosonate cytidylyltransferase, partial [Thiomargarita sp.]|nr:3-deoxy-manno-octulosonate cytidylyltransferase [Thiomargarita sp.]